MKMDMTIFYFCHGLWVLWPPLIVPYARFYVDCAAGVCCALRCKLVLNELPLAAVGYSDCPAAAAAVAAASVGYF